MVFGDYLNYDEAVLYTGHSKRKIQQEVSDRKLTHIRIGRRIMFRRRDLDAWMARGLVKAVF